MLETETATKSRDTYHPVSLHFLVSKPQFSDGPVTFAKWFNL